MKFSTRVSGRCDSVTVLDVKNLKVYYRTLRGDVKAVDGVSFDLREGEVLGIAGESGCGKSTLVNFLVLRKPPMFHAGGNVFLRVNGEMMDITKLDHESMRRIRFERISIIPQYSMDALSPTKRIRRIIQDILKEHSKEYDEPSVVERLSMVNLPRKVLDMYPVELSGGMRQRATMVVSTLLNPDVLIADEITSALDVSTQKFVVEMLLKFKESGMVGSMIFITHDLSVLYQIADRVMILYAGKVVEIGPTEDIVKNPVHPYTRALIESLPRMGVRFERERLRGIPGQPPHLLNPPKGCRFKERCPLRSERCDEEPPMVEVDEDHVVFCWEVRA